jgi:hypothetical protein
MTNGVVGLSNFPEPAGGFGVPGISVRMKFQGQEPKPAFNFGNTGLGRNAEDAIILRQGRHDRLP